VLALIAASGGAIFLVATWLIGEEPDYDMWVYVPRTVQPNASLPVRVLGIAGLISSGGPRVVPVKGKIALEHDGRRIMQRPLTTLGELGSGVTFEQLPQVGELRVVIEAHLQTHQLKFKKRVRINAQASPEPLVERVWSPLARYELSALKADGMPQAVLKARVSAGTCVPNTPCTVVFYAGEQGLEHQVKLQGSGRVISDGHESRGRFRMLSIMANGPDVVLHLSLVNEKQDTLASRSLNIPVDSGVAGLRPSHRLLVEGQRLRLELPSDHARPVILDAFRDGSWVGTWNVLGAPIEFSPAAGFWRIQTRADPFQSDDAIVTAIYVRRANEEVSRTFEQLAQRAHVDYAGNPQTAEDNYALAAFLLAQDEQQTQLLPEPRSWKKLYVVEQRAQRARIRAIAVVGITAVGILTCILLIRRARAAQRESQSLMEDMAALGQPVDTRRQFALHVVYCAFVVTMFLCLAWFTWVRIGT